MNQSERVRRAGILCCSCARNAAYHRAGWDSPDYWRLDDFWRNANGNFLDMSVLEWCKLFADVKGKHYWGKVVKDPTTFMHGLLKSLQMTQADFDVYIEKCRIYRDKFLAHLDEESTMHTPDRSVAVNSASYLHNLLVKENPDALSDAPKDLSVFHEQRYVYAKQYYPGGT